LDDDFTRAVRTGLQREGTYRLASKGKCDIVVEGVIKSFTRSGLSYNATNVVQVQDYNLSAVAHITAYERASGKKLLDTDVSGSTQIQAGQDLNSAERQASPLLANSAARKAVDLLADGDW
jgi:hypothetical protein